MKIEKKWLVDPKQTVERHGEDAAYKSFSEVFSRLIEERSVQSSTTSNIQNQQKYGPLHRETIDLDVLSSADEGSVHNAETWNVDSVGNSEHQAAEPSGYYRSVHRHSHCSARSIHEGRCGIHRQRKAEGVWDRPGGVFFLSWQLLVTKRNFL